MFTPKTSFEEFIRDCQYVRGLSKATLVSYRQSLIAIEPGLEKDYADAAELRQGLKQAIVLMAESGKRNPAGINVIVRSLNSWLGWANREGQLDTRIVLKKMKEASMEMQTLSAEQILKWVRLKPKAGLETTIRMMVLLLLDTGLRVAEALDLKKAAVNWDDLLVTVIGKGKKQRTIPFSVGLRKEWYKFVSKGTESDFVFPSAAGTRLEYRNAVRKYRSLSKLLGIADHKGFHECRHTFGTGFIQAGGDVFALQRIMGHSSLSTTMRYVHLSTTDLSSKHRQHAKLLGM